MSSAVDLDERSGEAEPKPRRTAGDAVRTVIRGIGQTLVTLGLISLLFVVYELWATDIIAAQDQHRLNQQIQNEWADAPTVSSPSGAIIPAPIHVRVGQPFAVVHIPRLAGGDGFSRVVVEGTAQTDLAQGPGHYIGTAMPGEQGNAAFAGHRVGRGSPFLDLDKLRPGDPIVIETGDAWFVYRVLGDPATGSFTADPSGIPGQEIVAPTEVAVIAPTPGGAANAPASGAYLTLTTCHPKYSAQQRLVIHARLEGVPLSKAALPDGPPALNG